MTWVLIGIVLLFVVGPLRRGLLIPFVSAWRFTLPGIIAAGLALFVAARFVNAGAPALIMIIAPIMAFFMIGAAARQWFHDNLPPRER